jgi:K+-transporting ATPase KdpF subunit
MDMNVIVILAQTKPFEINSITEYAIGAIIAILMLGYLLYSLIKPEKF